MCVLRLIASIAIIFKCTLAQLTQDDFKCDYDTALTNSQVYSSIESLTDILAKQTDQPMIMDATNVEGAHPYFYDRYYIRPVYFQGLPYLNNCTLVFAWLSTPISDNVDGGVSGVVLAHGGGGTAMKVWCEKWAENNVASIAIGLEGQTDEPAPWYGWTKTLFPGPRRRHAYSDYELPVNHQWMFHAVAQSMLANTLLRSQPFVNQDLVGVAGVSWGGAIASTMLSVDYERLAFGIPAYGCGSMMGRETGSGISRQMASGGAEAYYSRVWDPTARFQRLFRTVDASLIPPTLWISWPEESHFPIDRQALTYNTLLHHGAEAMVLLVPKLGHSHGAIWRRPESYFFVKNVVDTRQQKLRTLGQASNSIIKGNAYVLQVDQIVTPSKYHDTLLDYSLFFRSRREFDGSMVVYTCDDTNEPVFEREWLGKPSNTPKNEGCEDMNDKNSYCIYSVFFSMMKDKSCAFYVTLRTTNGMLVSSPLQYTHQDMRQISQ